LTLLERAVATAVAVADQVFLSTGTEPRYRDLGLTVLLDPVPDAGPLGGIVAGLEAATHETFIVLAVDLPLVSDSVIELLVAALGDHDLVMPRTPERLQPLCCVGHRAPCLAAARRLIVSDFPAPHRLMELVKGRELRVDVGKPGESIAPDRIPAWTFLNVNTLDDLQRAEALIGYGGSPTS
jgi:molybdopterin-guanine dinucleotide biosynthesis protein A